MTKTKLLGLCVYCERDIAVRKGVLVHHGYERPGDGHQHGDCPHVGLEPYEKSLAPARDLLEVNRRMLDNTISVLERLEGGLFEELRDLVQRRVGGKWQLETKVYHRDVPEEAVAFERLRQSSISKMRLKKSLIEMKIAWLEARISEWRPGLELRPAPPLPETSDPYWIGPSFYVQREGTKGACWFVKNTAHEKQGTPQFTRRDATRQAQRLNVAALKAAK